LIVAFAWVSAVIDQYFGAQSGHVKAGGSADAFACAGHDDHSVLQVIKRLG
jgi:hypothetical protein